MRVSAFGNNKLCYKPFHLLKTCASRVGSLSEHVLTKKPTVLTSPSNVNRTKRPSASSMNLLIERYNVHHSVALKEPRLPALNMRAAYCLHPPIFQLQTACVRLYRARPTTQHAMYKLSRGKMFVGLGSMKRLPGRGYGPRIIIHSRWHWHNEDGT